MQPALTKLCSKLPQVCSSPLHVVSTNSASSIHLQPFLNYQQHSGTLQNTRNKHQQAGQQHMLSHSVGLAASVLPWRAVLTLPHMMTV